MKVFSLTIWKIVIQHRFSTLVVLALVVMLLTTGCGVRIFISDTRLRGAVPPTQEPTTQMTRQAEAESQAPETAAPALARGEVRTIARELESRVGQDLTVQYSFSGRETPNAGPLRGMRVEPGDTVRVSAGRSQDVAVQAGEFCVDGGAHCSTIWMHGRPRGGSQGAWYPIVIFDYPPEGN